MIIILKIINGHSDFKHIFTIIMYRTWLIFLSRNIRINYACIQFKNIYLRTSHSVLYYLQPILKFEILNFN